ncbi:hypothetical protein E0Z10_g10294 [Xylaria hypoxylon]|uniref:Rhodopsin domain-containing protein n=1 Tax=Xylaria hypoxylon TaxID=37992 RepID=A0A4Z0YF05_9PEZI|nr:hypothetical protein E0Z10_g10294 [Xylaria hypoxylon]
MSNGGQGISQGGFLAVLWVLAGLATVLFLGRLLVRSALLNSFHADDLFGALAWFFMIVTIILATVSNPLSYKSSSILVGESPMPPPAELVDITITLRKWNVAGQTLFWTRLYCVKLSFMFLYRMVFGRQRNHRLVWTLVLVYIILTYGICLISVFSQCGDVRHLFQYEECMTPYVASLDSKLVWVDYFFNVTSDLTLVIIPMPIIWRLNMHVNQKLAVTAICSLALITIAFETVRTCKLHTQNFTLTNLYSYLELLVAVLIGMLPSYRFLVSPSDKDREYRRLFWSRITLRGNYSNSSVYSMQNLSRGQANQSNHAGHERTSHP